MIRTLYLEVVITVETDRTDRRLHTRAGLEAALGDWLVRLGATPEIVAIREVSAGGRQ